MYVNTSNTAALSEEKDWSSTFTERTNMYHLGTNMYTLDTHFYL